MAVKVLETVLQIESTLDKDGHLCAVAAVGRMCDSPEAKACVEGNRAIIDYIKKAFGNDDLVDSAAETLYYFIVNGKHEK